MKLLFDWCDAFYEEKIVWRGDEDVISLEISQKECGFASARVSIKAKSVKKLLDKRYAKIGIQSDENEKPMNLLFTGRLVAFPIGLGNSSLDLELIAEPDDYQMQLQHFSQQKNTQYKSVNKHVLESQRIIFDDLFFSANDSCNPTVFLEGGNEIFYWDMKSGKLSLSHINRGVKNIDINGNEILQNSIKIRIAREPYRKINIKLSTSWIQYVSGIIDVFPMIAQKFNSHLVNSFANIKTGIENLYKISNKNGYSLIRGEIREINPNTTGILSDHPVISPDFFVQDDDGSPKKKVNFKRFYFDGKILFGWNYKQKRTEIVRASIVNGKLPRGREKNLFLKLNSIQSPRQFPVWACFAYYRCGDKILHDNGIFECKEAHISDRNFEIEKWQLLKKTTNALIDDTKSSFFATDRGKNTIKYAVQKAVALMNYSSRYIEIDFCVDAKKFVFATINDQISIHDARFQENVISGKIIKTKFIANADQQIMKITMGCSENTLEENCFEKITGHSIDITEDDSRINPSDVVTNIEIKNSPEEQIAFLSQKTAKSIFELKNALKKCVTNIKLSLHPLNTTRVVAREVNLPDFNL
jgi:hypothetical protein